MINFDDYTNEDKTEHDLRWPYIPDHPYRVLIIGASGPEKPNELLSLIKNVWQKDPYEIWQKIHMKQNINI